MADGLARAYQEHSESNCRQVINDLQEGLRINQELRGEMGVYTQRYEQSEAKAVTQIQTLREAAVYWRAESDQEARVAARNSEQSQEASRRCLVAEQTLRQKVVPNLPQTQIDLHNVIHRIEQEAMQHVLNKRPRVYWNRAPSTPAC